MLPRFTMMHGDAMSHEYVAAIVATDLEIVGCHEPAVGEETVTSFPCFEAVPAATREAFLGLPYLLIWDLLKRT